MSKVKLKATLPVGEANGLMAFADQFIDEPSKLRVAVVVLDTKATTEDRDAGEVTATVRVRRIEVISDPTDIKTVQEIALSASEQRTGKTVLPFDTDEQASTPIGQLFADWANVPTNGKAPQK